MTRTNDKVYSQLKKHFDEVYSIKPSDLRFPWLTKIYKYFSGYVKFLPFRVFVPLSAVIAFIAYIIFGLLIIRLVSILQYGF